MYKQKLEEYIEKDKIYQDWCDKNTSYVSDFDRFCIQHCRDIEDLLKEVEELHNKIDKANEYIENADWYLPLWECRDNQPDKNIFLEILKDNE